MKQIKLLLAIALISVIAISCKQTKKEEVKDAVETVEVVEAVETVENELDTTAVKEEVEIVADSVKVEAKEVLEKVEKE